MPDTDTDTSSPPAPPPPAQGNFYGPQGTLGNALPGISDFGRWFSQHVAPAFSVKPQPAPAPQPATPPQQPPTTGTPDPNLPPKQDQPQQQKNLNELFPQIPDISKQLRPPPDPITSGRRIQQFIPNSTREAKLWGRPNRHMDLATRNREVYTTPFMPSDQEAIRVIAGGGRQLSQFAAPSVGGPMGAAAGIASMIGPFFDFFSGNAFSTAYRNKMLGGIQAQEAQMRMQEENMMMQRERMIDLAQQGMINHKLMLSGYGEVFDELNSGAITEDEARDRILQLNTENHHHVLDGVLENQGPGGVQRALALEDARFQDIMSSVMSLQSSDKKTGKTTGETSIDREIEGRPSTGAIGSALLGAPVGTPGAVGPDGKPAGPTGFTPEDIRDKSPQEINDEVAKEAQMPTAGGMHYADQILETGTLPGMNKSEIAKASPKYAWSLDDAAARKKAMIQSVADSDMSEEDKLKAIDNINPNIGNKLAGLASYKIAPTAIPEGTRADYESWLAKITNNQWSPGKYAAAEKYYNQSSENRVMASAAAVGQNGLNVIAQINQMKENETMPARTFEQIVNGTLIGDPKWGAMSEAMQNFIQNASSVQTGTAPRVTLVKSMMDRAQPNMSPAQLRLIMQQTVADTWAKSYTYIKEWKEDLHQPGLPPVFDKNSLSSYSTMLRMDAYKGVMPSDSLPEWLAISRDPAKTKYPSYVKDRGAPWTAEQYRKRQQIIDSLRGDPRPEAQALLQEYLKRTPPASPVINPPWQWHDAD